MVAIHRRWFLKGGLALGVTSLALVHQKAMARERISVSTTEEFFYAIGSNRTIILEPGTYFLSDLPSDLYQNHALFRSVFDGYELVISNVENLTIIGRGDKPVSLLVRPRYANILNFQYCNNIEIENIQAGHSPEEGYCVGGVLLFNNTSNVNIQSCDLFGSGTMGIDAVSTDNLICRRTIIRDCSYHILSLKYIDKAMFIDCDFFDNRGFEMVLINDSPNVEFRNCNFSNNTIESVYSSTFFSISSSAPVRLIDCLFRQNSAETLVEDPRYLDMTRTRFENNSFQVTPNYRG